MATGNLHAGAAEMIHEGVRIWARVAIRSYMRKNGAISHAEADGGEEEGGLMANQDFGLNFLRRAVRSSDTINHG